MDAINADTHLQAIRDLAEEVLNDGELCETEAGSLASLVRQLDDALTHGAPLPKAWHSVTLRRAEIVHGSGFAPTARFRQVTP